jgi:hypothetical protein
MERRAGGAKQMSGKSLQIHTMTPKLKLNPALKKGLLSSILKSFFPGNCRIIKSTHIMDAISD